MAYAPSQSGRLYLATQTSLNTAATLSGTNCCRHTKANIKNDNPRYPRNDKTGTLSRTAGIGGLRKCQVDLTMDVAGHGSAGVAPDCDPILQSLFGQAPTVVATTSVTYALADTTVPVTVGHFRLPSTVNQRVAYGVNFQSAAWKFNEAKVASWTASGPGVWSVDSLTFSALDSVGKGGIATAPVEPSSPSTNGSPAASFLGSIVIDSNTITTFKSADLSFSRPIEVEYSYGGYYSTSMAPGLRDISVAFDLFDDDSSNMVDLLTHGIEDNLVNLVLVNGLTAGNIWTWTLKNLQLLPPGTDDNQGNRWVAAFDKTNAAASSTTATDEIGLVIT